MKHTFYNKCTSSVNPPVFLVSSDYLQITSVLLQMVCLQFIICNCLIMRILFRHYARNIDDAFLIK